MSLYDELIDDVEVDTQEIINSGGPTNQDYIDLNDAEEAVENAIKTRDTLKARVEALENNQ
jgi:hypothetical protein